MLPLPQRGIQRSIRTHNSSLDVLCDWVELSALVAGSELSRADIVDFLIEEQVYDDQDFCSSFVGSVWSELRRRQRWLGEGKTLAFDGQRIVAVEDWRHLAANPFCILLSLAPQYAGWFAAFGSDYSDQGRLFELLTIEALSARFKGWEFRATGWNASTTVSLSDVVPGLAEAFVEEPGNVEKWASGKAHEAGLDLAWYMPFPDNRSGLPVYLGQCASGANWHLKVHTPELPLWNKLIDFTHPPAKAVVVPFALTEEVFQLRRVLVHGLLVDRYRLLPALTPSAWLSSTLREQLVPWCEARIAWLATQNP